MPGSLRITPGWELPDTELSVRFSRSSGRGGQHVNTSDTRVELSYDVAGSASLPAHLRARALARLHARLVAGVLTVVASTERSQLQNRVEAERRLAQLLREAVAPPPPPRRATRPTRAAKERRLAEKRQRSQVKQARQARPPREE